MKFQDHKFLVFVAIYDLCLLTFIWCVKCATLGVATNLWAIIVVKATAGFLIEVQAPEGS